MAIASSARRIDIDHGQRAGLIERAAPGRGEKRRGRSGRDECTGSREGRRGNCSERRSRRHQNAQRKRWQRDLMVIGSGEKNDGRCSRGTAARWGEGEAALVPPIDSAKIDGCGEARRPCNRRQTAEGRRRERVQSDSPLPLACRGGVHSQRPERSIQHCSCRSMRCIVGTKLRCSDAAAAAESQRDGRGEAAAVISKGGAAEESEGEQENEGEGQMASRPQRQTLKAAASHTRALPDA